MADIYSLNDQEKGWDQNRLLGGYTDVPDHDGTCCDCNNMCCQGRVPSSSLFECRFRGIFMAVICCLIVATGLLGVMGGLAGIYVDWQYQQEALLEDLTIETTCLCQFPNEYSAGGGTAFYCMAYLDNPSIYSGEYAYFSLYTRKATQYKVPDLERRRGGEREWISCFPSPHQEAAYTHP